MPRAAGRPAEPARPKSLSSAPTRQLYAARADTRGFPDGTRAVVAQRIDGGVAISDIPVGDSVGRVYLIERHVHCQAELTGLVAAYVAHSTEARCPAVIAQRRQLDELVDAVA